MGCRASVIVPVYNAEKTLRRCVESVVLGRERNVEVILVDDCSTDGSWELCCSLAEEFRQVISIQNSRNMCVSYTRNQGLAVAKGEYILFVDSDDWVSEKYADALLRLAAENPHALPICGHHFINKVNQTKQEYTWSSALGTVSEINAAHFYELTDRCLMQQIWNKAFRRDVIEAANLRFDETQSMGEDFQFVLDYMEAIQCKKCVVLNEPLYYYIRWGDSSLMSKFGLIQTQQEYGRAEQLHRLAGDGTAELRDNMILRSKKNYVYHIVRNRNLTKCEKLDAIERIMEDGKSKVYFRKQKVLYRKEIAQKWLNDARTLHSWLRRKLWQRKLQRKIAANRAKLNVEGFSLISQNCIGGIFYHDMGLQFLSPTVNLFFDGGDFVRFVQELPRYLAMEPEMFWGEEYPLGRLGDVTVHFMHYETCADAKAAWNRRKDRINWEKLLVLCTDMEGFTDAVFEQWKKIPYSKVLFTANETYAREPGSIYYPQFQGKVDDLIPGRLFYKDEVLINTINDMR